MPSDLKRLNRIRFDLLLILISLIIAITIINLFCLVYIYTFKFNREFYDAFYNQLPFLIFEIIILLHMEFFSIYSASKIYCFSKSTTLKSKMTNLAVIWCFLILFEVVIAIQFFTSSGEIFAQNLDDFYNGYHNYLTPSDNKEINFVNLIQTNLQCCGIENSTDWEINRPPSSTQDDIIPDSCCKSEFRHCNKKDSDQINDKGCGKAILDWSLRHTYIFLSLWLILVVLSSLFCYLLKRISESYDDNQAIVSIKPILSDNESENLMSTNKKVLDYQNMFKECDHIGYPIKANQDFTSKEDLNSSLTKITRYSQIKYSKVKPTNSNENLKDEDEVELTCHQDKELNDIDLDSDQFKKHDKLHNFKRSKHSISSNSIKSIDKLDKDKSIRNLNHRKPGSRNPNYNPNFNQDKTKCNDIDYDSNCNTPSSENSSSDRSSSLDDNSKLIHPNDKLCNLDKLKNKFIEPYSSVPVNLQD